MSSPYDENHDSLDQITQSQQVQIDSCSHRIKIGMFVVSVIPWLDI